MGRYDRAEDLNHGRLQEDDMKIAFIVPFAHLEEFDEYSDFHLILAQHIQTKPFNNPYIRFFMFNKKYKILDNGAYEMKYPVPDTELIEKAHIVEADEIIVPDVFMECDETLKRVENFLRLFDKEGLRGKFKLMAAPQGKDNAEYMKSLGRIQDIKEIDVIGLSFLVVARCFEEISACKEVLPNRQMLTKLIDLMAQSNPDKEYHLLGLGNCKELAHQKQYPWIRGNDSSSAFKHGLNRIAFHSRDGLNVPRIKEKLNFNEVVENKEIKDIIKHNMGVVKDFAK